MSLPRIYACNWTLMPVMDTADMIRFAAREGFAGLELECGPLYFWPTVIGDAEADELKRLADGEGVALSVHAPDHVNPAGALPEDRVRDGELLRRLIDLAVRLDSQVVGVHPGIAAELFDLERRRVAFDTARFDRVTLMASARARAVETLAGWADQCAAAGLVLTVENEVHVRHTVAPTAAILRGMVETAARPNLKVNLDTGHAYCGGGLAEEFAALKDYIVHVHLNDGDTPGDSQHLPIGEGAADWAPLAPFLASFGGIIVLEIYAPTRPVEATLASRDFLLRTLAAA